MNKIVYLLTLVIFSISCQTTKAQESNEIHWMSLEEALELQKTAPKKIFMDVYTKWCGPCKMLDKNTFHNPDVVKYVNEHYYGVKFDAESPTPIVYKGTTYSNPTYDPNKRGRNGVHELSRLFQISAYPTMLFLDEKGDPITKATGYLQPAQLEYYLKTVAEEVYLRLKTEDEWKKYQNEFQSTFK